MSDPVDLSKDVLGERQAKLSWSCRFHPFDWWHEVGCPHMEWDAPQLMSALLSKKETENSTYDLYVEVSQQYQDLAEEYQKLVKAKEQK